jgi:transposase
VAAQAQVRAELVEAREQIAELEARLKRNPRNSSRPPSSEGLAKDAPKPRSLRKKTGRKPGGQDGHKGTTLAQVARPDREIRHEPGCCGRCGAGLAGRPVTGVERRQLFDLPPVRAEVTGHQLIERECGSGQRTKGAAPPGAEAPVQYGPRIAAVITYLYAGQFLSKERTALALGELFGVPCPSGTVAALTARAAGRLDGFLEQVRQGITASDVAGSDETGFRVEGRLDRRPSVLRYPQLPVHRRQTAPQLLRCPRHARQRRALDAHRRLISYSAETSGLAAGRGVLSQSRERLGRRDAGSPPARGRPRLADHQKEYRSGTR